MPTPPERLLRILRGLGMEVRLLDGRVAVRDPQRLLTDELRAEIRARSANLVSLLMAEASVPAASPAGSISGATHPCAVCSKFAFRDPDVICFWCRKAARQLEPAA